MVQVWVPYNLYYYWSILHLIHTSILHPMNAFLKHSLLENSLKWILCSAITIIFHHISWAKIIIVYTATIMSGRHTDISFHSRFSHSQAFRSVLFFLFLLFWHYIRSHVLQICGNVPQQGIKFAKFLLSSRSTKIMSKWYPVTSFNGQIVLLTAGQTDSYRCSGG